MTSMQQLTYFGNPILREKARPLTIDEIHSTNVQDLIADMQDMLTMNEYGVGLAAPQVGIGVAIIAVHLKPTPTLPELEPYEAIFINPIILETVGEPKNMWEGCISAGVGENTLCAKVPRPNTVRLQWLDEHAVAHEEVFEGFIAHTVQHEVDHLNGVLFVDRVKDTHTYMLLDEYRASVAKITEEQ